MNKNKTKNAVATVASAISAYSVVNNLAKDYRTKWEETRHFTSAIDSQSYVYDIFLTWLNNNTNNKNSVFSSRYDGVARLYDPATESYFYCEGHKIMVKPGSDTGSDSQNRALSRILGSMTGAPKKIRLVSKTAAGMDAVQRLLNDLTQQKKHNTRESSVYASSTYGDWSSVAAIRRTMDSVFLPEGDKERLVADVDKFMANEKTYALTGSPWHRGYMFYGPPGNGKSSLASAISEKYNLNLYSLTLSGIKNDRELAAVVSEIARHSVLLLEDIDVFSETMQRVQNAEGPTLAGLLNTLDGVSTPHGLITVMNTNRVDTLDPALVRPGRVDFSLELKPPTPYQIESMFRHVYDEELDVPLAEFPSMAAVSEVFKTNIGDVESTRLALKG